MPYSVHLIVVPTCWNGAPSQYMIAVNLGLYYETKIFKEMQLHVKLYY